MDLDDPLLPAAPYLTGPYGADVLAPAITAAGGVLLHAAARQVIYRPSRDLTVMFAASVSWAGAPPTDETFVAGTFQSGPIAGTVAVEADDLQVSVWRYPFDPFLPGLADAVTSTSVAALLRTDPESLQLQVVSFRACRRAVVRVRRPGVDDLYVKVVPPAEVEGLVTRHEVLRAGGLPVPELTDVFAATGLVVSRSLPGRDLRAAVMDGQSRLPAPEALRDVVDRFAAISVPVTEPVLALHRAAPRHAAMLRTVLPGTTARLQALLTAIASDDRAAPLRTVHGDLHDAQLRVDDRGHIVGVLDVDGAGPGDPLDDLARLTAHLHALAVLGDGVDIPNAGSSAATYAERTWAGLRSTMDDPAGFDRRVAAALIGLATGPYRSQGAEWERQTNEVLSVAERLVAHERCLSNGS